MTPHSASSGEATAAPAVALIHDWLTGMRGGEKVLEAIASLYPRAPIHTLFHFPGSVSSALESHPIATSFLQRAPGAERHYRRYLPLFPAAIEDFDLSSFDLVISTSHCVAKGVIPAPHAYHVCYCHTPMRYAWDQEHTYFPRRRGLGARARGVALTALRAWDVASAARVDRFVANSRFVARRIARYYRRSADVIPPPVDTEYFTPGEGPQARSDSGYCVMVTALAPYKRVEVAMQACERVGIELRVVGSGPLERRLIPRAGQHTRLLGRVQGDELRELLRGARCLLQPGIEDFGIAPVEALACGTPVVARGLGGVLDIVEDGAHGVLYGGADQPLPDDESEVAALAAAIDRCGRIRWNIGDLRGRAEAFSIPLFIDRFASLLPQRAPGQGEGSP